LTVGLARYISHKSRSIPSVPRLCRALWMDGNGKTHFAECLASCKSLPKNSIHRVGWIFFFGEATHIFLEHLSDNLFLLRDRFKDLGMDIVEGKVYLPDLECKDAFYKY